MNPSIANAAQEVQHAIVTLKDLYASPVAQPATLRSIRMALALLHSALDAIDAVSYTFPATA